MRDWRKFLAQRLGKLGSSSGEQDEILNELASHMDELYEELKADGMDDSDATARVLAELAEGRGLGRRIRIAKEGAMNDRTRQFWVPGLASLFAASVFLTVFAKVSYLPHMLVVRSGVALMMYPAWLVAQPIFGAIGAYFSRRAGGNRTARIFAALSPSIALFALICIGVIVQLVMAGLGKPSDIGSMGSLAFVRAIFFALIVPSIALFLGALPFLRDRVQAA
jgi:hypothetical protein